jgi:hypothetical protein
MIVGKEVSDRVLPKVLIVEVHCSLVFKQEGQGIVQDLELWREGGV